MHASNHILSILIYGSFVFGLLAPEIAQGQSEVPNPWWLDNIGVSQLRTDAGPSGDVYGSSDISVAIIDFSGVNCKDPDLSGKCADPPKGVDDSCLAIYDNRVNSDVDSRTHGTKAAALVAGAEGSTDNIQGVKEGVAWHAKLLPFTPINSEQPKEAFAMDCAVAAGARILNLTFESAIRVNEMKHAVCNAVCKNRLVVAPAGNFACKENPKPSYPASYADDGTMCDCGDSTIKAGDRMLKVGGTDMNDQLGNKCELDLKSQLGEIYAPGWGVPSDDNNSDNYGTSWSAALVSGCAGIVGAVMKSYGNNWDADAVAKALRENSDVSSDDPQLKLLNCKKAVDSIRGLVGDKDKFVPGNPVDTPPRSQRAIDLVNFIANDPGQDPGVDLDKDGANRPVGLTHYFVIPSGALITSAKVKFRVRSTDSLVFNDGIYYNDTVQASPLLPVIVLRDLLGREPQAGEVLPELEINLGKVPVRTKDTTGGPGGQWSAWPEEFRNLLGILKRDNQLDLVFSDDVTVDYSQLTLTYILPDALPGDLTGDGKVDRNDLNPPNVRIDVAFG